VRTGARERPVILIRSACTQLVLQTILISGLSLASLAGDSATVAAATEQVHVRRGLHFAQENRIEQAITEFDQCKNLAALPDPQIIVVLKAYGEGEEQAKMLPLANALVERQKLAKTPISPQMLGEALHQRSCCYDALRKYPEAAADCLQAAALCKNEAPMWIEDAGDLYRRAKMFDKAVITFDRSIALKPGRPGPYYHKGQCFTAQRRWAEALPPLSKAIDVCVKARKTTPESFSYIIMDCYKERAQAYTKLGQLDKARADKEASAKLTRNWEDTAYGGTQKK